MFGYIRPRTGDLLVREEEYYRGVYCGLCRAHGKCTGNCSRLFLSYDHTFTALVRSVLAGEVPVMKRRRCLLHPFAKRPMMEKSPSLEVTAYLAATLAAGKNRDDRQDEHGAKRARAVFLMPFLAGGSRKSRKKYPALERTVTEGLDRLADLEKQNPASVDAYAEVFGGIMADLFCFGLEGTPARLGRTVGYHIGKWVYILDAADDYDEDVQKGRFNPFVTLYGSDGMTKEQKECVERALLAELSEAEKAFDLFEFGEAPDERQGILKNLLYLGMPDTAKRILYKERKEKDGKGDTAHDRPV